jgi:hypothetical protein
MGKEREGITILHNEKNSRTISKTDSVVDSVIDQLIDRARVGKAKYKTTMDREDLTLEEWTSHTIEELLDAALYLTKIKQVMYGNRKS